jgi:hypothetical protein
MALPFEFKSSGAALTAAMSLIGTTRKKFVVTQIINKFGALRWIVTHPDGNPSILYEVFTA